MQGYFIRSVVLAFLADNEAHAESFSFTIVGKRFVSQQAGAVFLIPVKVGPCACFPARQSVQWEQRINNKTTKNNNNSRRRNNNNNDNNKMKKNIIVINFVVLCINKIYSARQIGSFVYIHYGMPIWDNYDNIKYTPFVLDMSRKGRKSLQHIFNSRYDFFVVLLSVC